MPHKIPESVLVVLHSPDGDMLLLERADHPGFWQSVTGSKDTADERPCDTAVREVFEETGLRICLPEGRDGAIPFSASGDVAQAPASMHTPYVLNDLQHHIQYEIFEHWRWRYAPGVTHNTEHWFSVCVPRDAVVTLAPREHLQSVWMPFEQAAERCFSWSNCDAIRRVAGLIRAA